MLLLLVLGMLEVLVLLVVLEDPLMFVGGIFKRVKSPDIFLEKIIESKKKIFGSQNNEKKSFRLSKKSTLTLDTCIALFPFEFLSFATIFSFISN